MRQAALCRLIRLNAAAAPERGTGLDFAHAPTVSTTMTVHTPKLLTPEEFASLIEVAVTAPNPKIPAPHLAKLVALGFVAETLKGPVVTGDGLIRITESE
jgi:hypothetical protein